MLGELGCDAVMMWTYSQILVAGGAWWAWRTGHHLQSTLHGFFHSCIPRGGGSVCSPRCAVHTVVGTVAAAGTVDAGVGLGRRNTQQQCNRLLRWALH